MHAYQEAFIRLAVSQGALCFGEFTLKSGRISPYFFNAGCFSSGNALLQLGRSYAAALTQTPMNLDALFGPAYKGIPIVAAMATALADQHQRDLPYAFNRKEAKDHGEGGILVGAPLAGKKVLIVDDVITAGTAIHHSVTLLQQAGATVAGILVAFDRQEKGQGSLSAIGEVQQRYQVPVLSIVNFNQLLKVVKDSEDLQKYAQSMESYRHRYAVSPEKR